MKIIFFTNSPTIEHTVKSLSEYHDFDNTFLLCKNPKLVATKNIKNIIQMKSIEDIYKLSAEFNDDCLIAPLGVSFDYRIVTHFGEFKKAGLITWGFSKNNVIYNKFDDSIRHNIIGLSAEASKECNKDLRIFSLLTTTHIPEILCNL